MFVLAAALKSQYIMSAVTQAEKISQRKTPITNTESGRNKKTKSTKKTRKREEIIVRVEITK